MAISKKVEDSKTNLKKKASSSLTKQVIEYLNNKPDAANKDLYEAFPDAPKASIRVHKSTFLTQQEDSNKTKTEVKKKAVTAKETKTKKVTIEQKVKKIEVAKSKETESVDKIEELENKINLLHKKFESFQNDQINQIKSKIDQIEYTLKDLIQSQKPLTNIKSFSKTVSGKFSSIISTLKK